MVGAWKGVDHFLCQELFGFPDVGWAGKFFTKSPSIRQAGRIVIFEDDTQNQGRCRRNDSNVSSHFGSRRMFEAKLMHPRFDEVAFEFSLGIGFERAHLSLLHPTDA